MKYVTDVNFMTTKIKKIKFYCNCNTVLPEDFKNNWNYFQWDVRRVKEFTSGVQNITFLESLVESCGIYQLGNLSKSI